MSERRLSGGKASRLAAFSWILYDFSNTIFSVTILSFYFPLWVEEQVGSGGFLSGPGLVNPATAVSALFVAHGARSRGRSGPQTATGALPDPAYHHRGRAHRRAGRNRRGSGGARALRRGRPRLPVRARFLQCALARRLCWTWGRQDQRLRHGRGYVGTILGLVVLTYFVENGETLRPLGPLGGWLETGDEVYSNAFVPTAVVYLVFSLPAFSCPTLRCGRGGPWSSERSIATWSAP